MSIFFLVNLCYYAISVNDVRILMNRGSHESKVATTSTMSLINIHVQATSNGVIVFILSVIQGNIRFAIASCSTTKTLVPSSIVEIQ